MTHKPVVCCVYMFTINMCFNAYYTVMCEVLSGTTNKALTLKWTSFPSSHCAGTTKKKP